MSLADDLCKNLADLFDLDEGSIELDDDGLLVRGESLGDIGVTTPLFFLNQYTTVSVSEHAAKLSSASRTVFVQRISLRNCLEYGLFEIESAKSWLLTGSFGSGSDVVDFSACPELLLALAVLRPLRAGQATTSWTAIFESWGPIVVSYGTVPLAALAEIGGFCFREPSPLLNSQPSCIRPFNKRPEVTDEAIQAYIVALEATDGPDVTFHRLYRVFELEFANALKQEIANTPLTSVYKKLKDLKLTELNALHATVARTTSSFLTFSLNDFDALFDTGHRPSSTYKHLEAWTRNRVAQHPPDICRADLIYYVRNALVHSKFSEGDVFLFGPYEGTRLTALENLVRDTVLVVRESLTS